MVLTNILIGVLIFMSINILGALYDISNNIKYLKYDEDAAKLRKFGESLIKGPIITKTDNRKGHGVKPKTERPKPKPRP